MDWPQLTVVTGPAASRKTHLIRARTRSDRTIWVDLRNLRDGTELAARLVGRLCARIGGAPR